MLNEMADRFSAKVERTDGCWLWTGATDSCGYGSLRVNGRHIGAHRMAWRLWRGEIPPGMHVLHACDVPNCVNPDHLWLGTHQDNMRDRDAKGRGNGGSLPGEACPHAKLDGLTVRLIRAFHADGIEQKTMGIALGIHKATINDIVLRKTWAHI